MQHYVNKIILVLTGTILALLILEVEAQTIQRHETIDITYNKTTSLVFPAVIKSVDRGSRDVLAQKAKGVDNVLQLKAGRTRFAETNLTVITADGMLHHFPVRYAEKPALLTIPVGYPVTKETTDALIFQSGMTEEELQQHARAILASPRKMRLKTTSKFDMRLSLQGIYISGNMMFYHLKVVNRSDIPYHTGLLRFYVKDKQKVKRTASQEVSESPAYCYGSISAVAGQSTEDVVYALPKFTIPDAKELVIELMEKRGGRHLQLRIRNKAIVHARPVTD